MKERGEVVRSIPEGSDEVTEAPCELFWDFLAL